MKTNLVIANGLYLKPIGEAVCVGAYGAGDDIDELLGDGYVDIFTGKLYGVFGVNYVPATPTWAQSWKVYSRKVDKKARRRSRINAMCGIHWGDNLKTLGENRHLRRRMYPSPSQIADFNSYLPF